MIDRFFTTSVTVRRQVYEGYVSEVQDVGTFNAHVQQMTPEEALKVASGITLSHRVWCPLGTDVRVGDTLVVDDWTYSVKAVMRNAVGTNQHLELLAEKDYELSA
jgi:SPP1 family predicted phage head-tail adaptor